MSWSVLAIDQSMTSTGWAHLKKGQAVPTWGRFTLPSWHDREGECLWNWFSWLGEKVVETQATALILENTFIPMHNEGLTNRIAQYGQLGMASAVAHLCTTQKGQPVDFSVVTPQQWRRAFLGSADAPKGLVQAQRRTWLKERAVAECHIRGWLVEGNDAADALGILAYACGAIDPAFAIQQGALFRRAEMKCENEERGLR
jgi:Holliday junction resolvasome RuvABC endonuclease subunit